MGDTERDPAPLLGDLYGLKELMEDMQRRLPDDESAEADAVRKSKNGKPCQECGYHTIISAGWCATCGWESEA